jgi:hypothetical protein
VRGRELLVLPERIVLGALVIAMSMCAGTLAMAGVFLFRAAGLDLVSVRLLGAAGRRGWLGLIDASRREAAVRLHRVLPARMQRLVPTPVAPFPSLRSVVNNFRAIRKAAGVAAGYGFVAGGVPALLFPWLARLLHVGFGRLGFVIVPGALLMGVYGAASGVVLLYQGLVYVRSDAESCELRRLSRRQPAITQDTRRRAQYNMSASRVSRAVMALAPVYVFIYGLVVVEDLASGPSTVDLGDNTGLTGLILFIAVVVLAVVLPSFVVGAFRRRMVASLALRAILRYRWLDDGPSDPRVGFLSPITDPVGERRPELTKLVGTLERCARVLDRRYYRLGAPPLMAVLIRGTCAGVRQAMRGGRMLDAEPFADVHAQLDGLATCLATPGLIEPVAALAKRLEVFGEDGQARADLVGRPPGRLVVLSDRLSHLLDHVERPIRLFKFVGWAVVFAGAVWLVLRHGNLSALTILR